jgi:hypothetical protein
MGGFEKRRPRFRLAALRLQAIGSLFCAAFVAGCASTPTQPISIGSPPSGQAQLVITRTDEFMYALVSPAIEVNGVKVAELARGQTYATAGPPGPVTVAVYHWQHPGRYRITINTQAGKTYRMIVSPRSESMYFGLVGGLAGITIDAIVNENSGIFQIAAAP